MMATITRTTAVGVFRDRQQAQRAVQELRAAGFRDDEIGMTSRDDGTKHPGGGGTETYAGEGAVAGVAAGAGVGALWGIGIASGLALPVIGPVIAGGTLEAVLASAATGAAAAGLVGALIGLGIPEGEAKYYEGEVQGGRTLVTVNAADRYDEANAILKRFDEYDYSRRSGPGAPPMI